MITKKIFYSVLCLLIITIVACSSTKSKIEAEYLSKKAPPYSKSLINSNHHTWNSKKFTLEYDFEIDESTNTITYDGDLRIIPEKETTAHSLNVNYITLYFLYINSDRIVVTVEERTTNPFKNLSEPIPFNVSTPFKPDFKEVIVFPSWYASGID